MEEKAWLTVFISISHITLVSSSGKHGWLFLKQLDNSPIAEGGVINSKKEFEVEKGRKRRWNNWYTTKPHWCGTSVHDGKCLYNRKRMYCTVCVQFDPFCVAYCSTITANVSYEFHSVHH